MLPHVGTLNSAYSASSTCHLSNRFGCSFKFFPLKIVLGLALDESCVLLGQQQKNTDILHMPVPVGGGQTQPSPPTSYMDRTLGTRTCTWAHLRAWGSIREIGCWYLNGFTGCWCNPAFFDTCISRSKNVTKGMVFFNKSQFESSPWAGLGRILRVACATTEKL